MYFDKDCCRALLGLLSLTLAVTACQSDSKSVGLVSAKDRPKPLTPATRAALVAQGAECTPNQVGPVLCTWSGNGVSCTLTFDQNDALTHLTCTVDTNLTWECTRPGQLYVCTWSDAPGCGDVYTLDGAFEAYLCGQALIDRIGGGSNSDGGTTNDPDGGTSSPDASVGPCENLDEAACVMGANPICRADYCQGCGSTQYFDRCVASGTPQRACPAPVCDCALHDQAGCEADPACHGVYVAQDACGCAPAGCCTFFQRCEPGLADCTGLDLACRQAEPACEGPFVPSYVNGCYEGCALASECAPSPVACTGSNPTFPSFDQSCNVTADCFPGIRQLNCCGTRIAVGINSSETGRFGRAASICASQFPACECVDQGIQVDNGSFVQDELSIGVSCSSAHVCTTFAIP